MNRADSLQGRIDALKRKCSTGYGCGSTCISLRKECRTSPGSAIGKERLKRLMALAAGGASSQRGIGTLKAQEAARLAGAITARRGKKAAQLRNTRGSTAQGRSREAKLKTESPGNDSNKQLSQSLLRSIDANDRRLGAQQDTRAQTQVYAARGYNAKPEVVDTRRQLSGRTDLIQDDKGRVIVLCRGITNDDDRQNSSDYIKDFREGELHFVGKGMHGNGTYAASGSNAHRIASEYTMYDGYGWAKDYYGDEFNSRANKVMMAFGIKKSANVVQLSTMEEFERFGEETIRKATEMIRAAGNTTGIVGDVGLAAAIVGIDAYSLPAPAHYRSSSRYWVILNRGAVVVARDGQWT